MDRNANIRYSYTNYTKVLNALDYPAATVPVTKVDPSLDVKKPAHHFLSEADVANYNLCEHMILLLSIYIQLTLATADEPAVFQNAPVALQVIGRTLEDEAVIAMAQIVDAALKSKSKAAL